MNSELIHPYNERWQMILHQIENVWPAFDRLVCVKYDNHLYRYMIIKQGGSYYYTQWVNGKMVVQRIMITEAVAQDICERNTAELVLGGFPTFGDDTRSYTWVWVSEITIKPLWDVKHENP